MTAALKVPEWTIPASATHNQAFQKGLQLLTELLDSPIFLEQVYAPIWRVAERLEQRCSFRDHHQLQEARRFLQSFCPQIELVALRQDLWAICNPKQAADVMFLNRMVFQYASEAQTAEQVNNYALMIFNSLLHELTHLLVEHRMRAAVHRAGTEMPETKLFEQRYDDGSTKPEFGWAVEIWLWGGVIEREGPIDCMEIDGLRFNSADGRSETVDPSWTAEVFTPGFVQALQSLDTLQPRTLGKALGAARASIVHEVVKANQDPFETPQKQRLAISAAAPAFEVDPMKYPNFDAAFVKY